jgi:Mn2+/Fe2+ NRAMP family transporter
LHWRVGLARKPGEAAAFYGVLAAATLLGVGITLTPLNPIQALYWSAVINGVVAVPVMIVMMLIASSPKVMGKLTVGGWLNLSAGRQLGRGHYASRQWSGQKQLNWPKSASIERLGQEW